MLALAAGYEFDVERGPDWLWIRVRSAANDSSSSALSSAPSLADEVKELIEKHFIHRIVLDLEHLPKLDGDRVLSSNVIGELVQVNRYLHAHDGVLRICGLSLENRALLEVCGLDDLCLDYHTLEEAIRGTCDPHCGAGVPPAFAGAGETPAPQ